MNTSPITIDAMLQSDGVTLQLAKKLLLPPGRVQVTVQPPTPPSGPTMLEVLERIHQDQERRGHKPMTEEEMASAIAQMRAEEGEDEERWRQIWGQVPGGKAGEP